MAQIPLNGTIQDTDIVRSIMLFPNDETLRSHYLNVLNLKDRISKVQDSELVTVTAGDLKALLKGPSSAEVSNIAIEAVKGGTIAGDLLAIMYIMDSFKGTHQKLNDPSRNKAIHVMKKFGPGRRFGDSSPLPVSKGTILKNRKEFESVAHLWAATRLNQDYPFCEPGAWDYSQDACYKMLAAAASILNFSTTYIPKKMKSVISVVNPDKVWTIPEYIGSTTLKSDRLPDQLIKYLESYKA